MGLTALISHDGRDAAVAAEIKDFLEEVFPTIDFYISKQDLKGGQVWIQEIKEKLKASSLILALLTKNSFDNNWIHFESGAGFTENKTIPIIAKNLGLNTLSAPMNLLQARSLTQEGVDELIRDISEKINSRTPKNYQASKLLLKIEKLISVEKIEQLKNAVSKSKVERAGVKEWIYKDNVLVFDYKIQGFAVAIDTYIASDRIEIQLFGRKEADEEYVLDVMRKADGFLPEHYDNYEVKGQRLIFKRDEEGSIETVSKSLIDLLTRIGTYKIKVEAMTVN